ncbi:MAG: phosphopantothenoylcysteine decarboxylase, partial [Bacteroidetes Order II. Incertae sedis bacterium]|nr:phosphopantothenoylcysteine decarboxylase [Bacteroidetes Order II. bacterium]
MNVSPSSTMNGRRILLGVSGGIAAYKIPELVRLFKKAGAHVKVVMTPDASRFVTPLTLGTLSENEVLTEIFPENESGSWTKHVSLGLWADLFIVAPATAQTITKLAAGSCDSMLTAVGLTARCPILVCPAMDHDMYIHPATEKNMYTLRQNGAIVMDAEHGSLASGLIGQGRLPEPTSIF